MSFRDFVKSTGRDLPDVRTFGPTVTQDRHVAGALGDLEYFVDDVDLAWQAYCEVGGFPRAVTEHHRDGFVSSGFAADILDWLAPDVTPGDNPESVLRLLSSLGMRMTSPLNVRRIAEELGMTRERLATRLNRRVTTFATFACPQVDDKGTAVAGSQQKVYLLDPLLVNLPQLVEPGFPAPPMSAVSEATLALAIARAIETVHPGRLLEGRAVGYVRTSTGEIDLAPLPLRVGGAEVRRLVTASICQQNL